MFATKPYTNHVMAKFTGQILQNVALSETLRNYYNQGCVTIAQLNNILQKSLLAKTTFAIVIMENLVDQGTVMMEQNQSVA